MGGILSIVCGDSQVSHKLIRSYYSQEQADFMEVFFSLNNKLNKIVSDTLTSLCPPLQIISYTSLT